MPDFKHHGAGAAQGVLGVRQGRRFGVFGIHLDKRNFTIPIGDLFERDAFDRNVGQPCSVIEDRVDELAGRQIGPAQGAIDGARGSHQQVLDLRPPRRFHDVKGANHVVVDLGL